MIFGFFRRSAVELTPGEEVELEISLEDGEEPTRVYPTDVLKSTKKEIRLIAPLEHNEAVSLPPGTPVLVHFSREEYVGTFQSTVMGEEAAETPPVLILAPAVDVTWEEKALKEAQRRQFVRLETALPVEFRSITGIVRHAITNDISGSGLSMVALFALDIGTPLKLKISLPDRRVETDSKVIRCKPLEGEARDGHRKYEVALSFVNMATNDQDAIIRHIFDRQRELRRRGLI